MGEKCRYPGCEIVLQTTTGRDYHETTAHGMIYNQPLQPLYQQMQLFCDISRIVRSTKLQITEILDMAFVDMINTHIHQSG